ncbi:hypothetical protein [Bacillus sp. B-jedd]|uniref:hypothetical protein n=1 Tax=Bacillus sp. B-jedd TaxID=1476857 RepID=UPI00051561AD|nr:hypothetical protein [Bacillus sp. B-jedd]CEG28823.1 anti-sigma factor [Bacillus sp. B-jedd]
MPINHDFLPVPYVRINPDGDIIGWSREAGGIFGLLDGLTISQLVDEESHGKLNEFIFAKADAVVEVNMKTVEQPLALFSLRSKWDGNGTGHVVALPADKANEELVSRLTSLQSRLRNTDFELFEKKEQLEGAMNRLNQLSGPFIPISEKLALVPLFGDLTAEKMEAITANVIHSAYKGSYDNILFDFNATGLITDSGTQKLHNLFQTLTYMTSPTITIIGINPTQAKQLHQHGQSWPAQFQSTLQKVLEK